MDLQRELEEARLVFGSGEGLAIAAEDGECYWCQHKDHGTARCECGCLDEEQYQRRLAKILRR